jgi:hypothetical protein
VRWQAMLTARRRADRAVVHGGAAALLTGMRRA